jgi:formylglycine-generating enzyme required for sulfatase activity
MVETPTGFCVDTTEVTNAQYNEFLVAMGSSTSGQSAQCSGWNTSFTPSSGWPAPAAKASHPVNYVDWCDAERYCSWAGKRLCGKVGGGMVPNDVSRKLPSVNEWINACTANGANVYPFGSAYVAGACNNADYGAGQPIAVTTANQCVGGYPGVYDMVGNVYEWVNACEASSTGALAADNACYIMGAAYYRNEANSRCDNTGYLSSRDDQRDDVGFRCCAD